MRIWQPEDSLEDSLRRLEEHLGLALALNEPWRELLTSTCDSWAPEQIALTAAIGTFFTYPTEEPDHRGGALRPFYLADDSDSRVIRGEIRDANPEWQAVWAQALPLVRLPVLKARLADLLWEARYGDRPSDFARQAAASYAEAASPVWDAQPADHSSDSTSEAVRCFRRARDLMRAINLDARSSSLPREICDALVKELNRSQSDARLYIATDLFDLCESVIGDADLGALDEPLSGILNLPAGDCLSWDWQLDCDLALAKRRGESRQAVVAKHVRLRIREAKASDSWRIRKQALEYADSIVSRAHNSDLAREVLHEIAETKVEFVEVSFTVPITQEEMDDVLNPIVGEDSAVSAMRRLSERWPDDWSEASVEAEVDAQLDGTSIADFVAVVPFDGLDHEMPALETDSEKRDHFGLRAWVWRAEAFGPFVVGPAFDRIRTRYEEDLALCDLESFFAEAWADERLASGLARALARRLEGCYEEAILLALRRIERILRDLVHEIGGVTQRPATDRKPQQAKSMSELIDKELKDKIDPLLWHYLCALFGGGTTLHLRDLYYHGLDAEPTPMGNHSALILEAVLYLWRDRIRRNAAAEAAGREDPDRAAV